VNLVGIANMFHPFCIGDTTTRHVRGRARPLPGWNLAPKNPAMAQRSLDITNPGIGCNCVSMKSESTRENLPCDIARYARLFGSQLLSNAVHSALRVTGTDSGGSETTYADWTCSAGTTAPSQLRIWRSLVARPHERRVRSVIVTAAQIDH